MSDIIHKYQPECVQKVIAEGGGSWIGELRNDKTTVLKYPHIRGDTQLIRIEAKMLEVLGDHPHIIRFKGLTQDGILLEFASHGSLRDYLDAHPDVPVEQRLAWCTQATEALAHAHGKRILHCDLRHDNLLLDSRLQVKLADFQGQYFGPDGQILLDGLSVESTRAYLPRVPRDHATVRTDLFALGSCVYYIMTGQEVFPELDPFQEEDEAEIERRFSAGEFPTERHACAAVTAKCWRQLYSSALEMLAELRAVSDAITKDHSLSYIASSLTELATKENSPPDVWWLSGLCREDAGGRTLSAPPPYRQLVEMDDVGAGRSTLVSSST